MKRNVNSKIGNERELKMSSFQQQSELNRLEKTVIQCIKFFSCMLLEVGKVQIHPRKAHILQLVFHHQPK